MADIRIKDLATLESASLTGDVFVIDGTTGTRKLSAFSPSFGGNATVTGTLTVNSTSSFAGLIQLNNNVAQYWLDSGATQRRTALVSSGNATYFGPIDAGWGSTGYFSAGTSLILRTNGASGTFNDAVSISTGGNVSIASTSASTTTSTGALVVSGGVGVGGAINASGNATVGGTLTVNGESVAISGGTPSGNQRLALSNAYDATQIGAFYGAPATILKFFNVGWDVATYGNNFSGYTIGGNRGIAGAPNDGHLRLFCPASHEIRFSTISSNDGWTTTNPSFTTLATISSTALTVNATTASTSTSSGALVVSGGVGVAGAVNAGTFYGLVDGVTAPATESGYARIYVDSADGDLKVKFGDGTVKTIATDS